MSAIERLSKRLSEIAVQEGLEDARYAMFCIGDLREIEKKMKILEESNEFLESSRQDAREEVSRLSVENERLRLERNLRHSREPIRKK